MTCSILSVLGSLLTLYLHPFHVSVSEIFHNQEKESLEITMKIFTDDLENALRTYSKYDVFLEDNLDDAVISKILKEYLLLNFIITVNGNKVVANYLGAEADMDAIWCYLEVSEIKKIKNIHIYNPLLMELFPDQVNLVHVDYKGKIKSLQLNINAYEGGLSTDNW